MRPTVRAAVAALAFTGLVAQPVAANASNAGHSLFFPLWAVSTVACVALTAHTRQAQGQVIIAGDGRLLLCAVPFVGLGLAIAESHRNKQPRY